MKVTKAVLPVAGMGTRFLPATKVVPKELLPIGDKPVIQYLVEEAVTSGIETIVFVISEDKEMIREYFTQQPALEATLEARGKADLLSKITPLHQMANFEFVYQREPKGDGDAILQAEEVIGNEPFLVLFGDDLVQHSVPAAQQLLNAFKGESVLATTHVPGKKISDYGVVDIETQEGRLMKVKGLVEKPAPKDAPSTMGIIGKYVCPPEIFEALRQSSASHGGELRLIDGFMTLSESQSIWAVEIEGSRFDTGRPEGLLAASNAFLGKT